MVVFLPDANLITMKQEDKAESTLKETAVSYAPSAATAERQDSQLVEDKSWIDFRDQCRRQMKRPMEARIKYGFCRMYKPVLDDAPWRAFATMAEYRDWCAKNLPDYLGFKQPAK
jgi:hypothetical protein